MRRVQFPQAHRDRRPARARGAAHRRPRQDRLPGRAEAAARRLRADRHHALPGRLGQALRRRAGFRASGAGACRSTASTCATRRAWKPSARKSWPRARAWTSSSATPARPCAGRRPSTRTCSSSSARRRAARLRIRARWCTCIDEHLEHAPGLARAPELSQLALLPEDVLVSAQLFPEGKLDADLQQVDLRERNSWRLQLDEVSARSSCWKCSWSTRSRPSCSMPACAN